jgi:hypothetical protein
MTNPSILAASIVAITASAFLILGIWEVIDYKTAMKAFLTIGIISLTAGFIGAWMKSSKFDKELEQRFAKAPEAGTKTGTK